MMIQLFEKIIATLKFSRSINYHSSNLPADETDVKISKEIILFFQNTNLKRRQSVGRWEHQINKREKVSRLILANEPVGLAYELANFYRRPLIESVIKSIRGFDVTRWGLKSNWIIIKEAYNALNQIKKIEIFFSIKLLEKLSLTTIGNPYIVDASIGPIHASSLHHLANNQVIRNKIGKDQSTENMIFCDIGSGIGEFALTQQQFFPKSKLILIDIPEILLLPYYTLRKGLPEKRVEFFFGDCDLNELIEKNDIILLPDMYSEHLRKLKVDVFTNMSSLGGMPIDVSRNYLDMIYSTLNKGGFFYSFNNTKEILGNTDGNVLPNNKEEHTLLTMINSIWPNDCLEIETIDWFKVLKGRDEAAIVFSKTK